MTSPAAALALLALLAALALLVVRRRAAAARHAWGALHDPLTSLPNRRLFLDRLDRAFVRSRRGGDALCAVLVVELDHLAQLEDGLGFSLGEQLVVAAGQRITRILRRNDTLSRLETHRFAVLMDDARTVAEAQRLAERLVAGLREPFELGRHPVICSASIGIAVAAPETDSAEELLRAADIAATHAGRGGGGACELSSADLRGRALERIAMHQDLAHAIREARIDVAFEPVVGIADGEIFSLEILAVWDDPRRGVLAAQRFIDVAERTGLIHALGRQVLRRACAEMRRDAWRRPPLDRVAVSLNVSPAQLSRAGLAEEVVAILGEHGVDPRRLIVEITESALISEPEAALHTVAALRQLGVRFHIDDFGTGYGSLTYLQRFPCEAIKLDRSFVAALAEDRTSLEIVRAGIALAHRLGKQVIAEGVETVEQLERLRALGCEYAQGRLFPAAAWGLVDRRVEDALSPFLDGLRTGLPPQDLAIPSEP
jgi:diguanylate cyclase (GGDEF)-like protein